MAYLLTDTVGNIAAYPYTYQQLVADNPNTSFPPSMSDADLALWNVFPVIETEKPYFDPQFDTAVESTPEYSDGVWLQTWIVRPGTADELSLQRSNAEALVSQQVSTRLREVAQYMEAVTRTGFGIQGDFNAYQATLKRFMELPGYPFEVSWPAKPSSLASDFMPTPVSQAWTELVSYSDDVSFTLPNGASIASLFGARSEIMLAAQNDGRWSSTILPAHIVAAGNTSVAVYGSNGTLIAMVAVGDPTSTLLLCGNAVGEAKVFVR